MQIKRPGFLATVFLFALFFCGYHLVFSEPTQSLVIVKGRNIPPYNSVVSAFKEAIQSHQNTLKIVEIDFEEGKQEGQINAQLQAAKPVLVLTLGTPATKMVRQLSLNAPVVYTMILDPAKNDILAPGVAINISSEAKLKELKMILPGIKALGVIYSSADSFMYEDISLACKRLGLRLVERKIDSQKDFPAAIEGIFREADCFLMIPDPNIYPPKVTEQLLLQGLQRKIPVIGLSASYAKAGAFIAFDCDYEDLGRQTAEFALRILTGDSQAAKEMQVTRKIKFSLNLQVAERLGVIIPQEILNEAGEVFGR
jgi:putative ABC transport system substrate-binding protein